MRRPWRGRSAWIIPLLLVAALALAAAGCGGDDDDDEAGDAPATTTAMTTAAAPPPETTAAPAPAEPTVIEIPATEQGLAFEETEVRAPAGTITLRMPNPSVMPHNIAVDEPEQVIGEIVEQGGVSEVTLDFPPGTYEYYCSLPGHREGGMVGTLIVE